MSADHSFPSDIPIGKRCNVRLHNSAATVTIAMADGSTVTFRVPAGQRFVVTNQGSVRQVHYDLSNAFIESENRTVN
jgi:hypothetical protein